MRRRFLVVVCAAGVTGATSSAAAQQTVPAPALPQPATAVLPRDIYVGDIFHAIVRLDLPVGTRAILPDTLLGGDELEPAGRLEMRTDSLPGGATRLTGLYPLTVWRTGETTIAPVQVRILADGRDYALTARFPVVTVTSVLPADTAGIEPKPAKDVIGSSRLLWPWILGGMALLLALIALYLWRRRRRPVGVAASRHFDPRAIALAALDERRAEELLRAGELRVFYIELAEALRFYAAAISPVFPRDLTTAELGASVRASSEVDERAVHELLELLEHADAVKFARSEVATEVARSDWHAARQWVGRVGLAAAAPADAVEEAA